jgi:hypothetical protein
MDKLTILLLQDIECVKKCHAHIAHALLPLRKGRAQILAELESEQAIALEIESGDHGLLSELQDTIKEQRSQTNSAILISEFEL